MRGLISVGIFNTLLCNGSWSHGSSLVVWRALILSTVHRDDHSIIFYTHCRGCHTPISLRVSYWATLSTALCHALPGEGETSQVALLPESLQTAWDGPGDGEAKATMPDLSAQWCGVYPFGIYDLSLLFAFWRLCHWLLCGCKVPFFFHLNNMSRS